MFAASHDGYVRLSLAELKTVSLVHCISGLDEAAPDPSEKGAVPTAISGYTEWVSSPDHAITLGWDWQMDTASSPVALRRIGQPRTNVMLRSSAGEDLGAAETLVLLGGLVDAFDWQTEVTKYIQGRYV